MKEYKATYSNESPQKYPNGSVTLDTDKFNLGTYEIMNWHTSQDLETVQVWNGATKRLFEIYSSDEGETFTFG